MCYRPLTFKSQMNHYDGSAHTFLSTCPCGKCEECKAQRQEEWFIRSFYEWQFVKKNGGQGYFYTLTYNEENLPHYHDIPCFDFVHVQKFIKRLQERLSRKFGITLGFLLCCEHGTLYQRPHYHVEFFLSKSLMPFTFYKEVEASWQYGFVYSGQNGGVMDSPNAILYVTKYISKDESFCNYDNLIKSKLMDEYERKYSEWYFHNGDNSMPSTFHELFANWLKFTDRDNIIKFYRDFRKDYNRYTIFHTSSLNLGISMLSSNYLNKVDDTILVPIGSQWKPLPLPRYIMRKLWYDVVPNEKDGKKNRFVLNDNGKLHILNTVDKKIEDLSLKFRDFFASTRTTDYQFECLPFWLRSKFDGNKDFRFFLSHIDVDWRKLAIYTMVYRNRVFLNLYSSFDYFNDYKSFLSDVLFTEEDKSLSPVSSMTTKEVNFYYNRLFNFQPQFQLYDDIFRIYQALAFLIRKEQAHLNAHRRENQRKLRDYQKILKLKIA